VKREYLKFLCDHTGSPMNPVLSNLLVYTREDGVTRAQAQNGRYTVDAPCDLPPMLISAARALAVWSACDDEPQVSLGANNLTVTSGRLRARIALLDPSQYPRDTPTAETAHTVAGLADTMRALLPFVAEDASRPWATSLCLTATHGYATNNVILARKPVNTGVAAPVNLPGGSVEAILDCGAIQSVGADANSVTFYLEGDIWVKCLLVAGDWPIATVDTMLGSLGDDWLKVNPSLEPMLAVAAKLADARHPVVVFKDNALQLEDDSLVASDLEPLPPTGKVNARMAALVFETATEVQWHAPRTDVHAFRAGDLVGVFGGQR
jgi:hypothetical protein